jgi:DNA-binding NarL/FixJ family response regulator
VDDHASIRKALCKYFTNETEYTVCGEAGDGLQALEMAERLKPDLIILDVSMPHMNGIEAAPRLKKISPNTPIIMLTLHHDSVKSQNLEKLGVSAVLSKTGDLGELANHVMKLLSTTA